MSRLLYTSRIESVQFSIAGTEDIINSSHVNVTSHELLKNDHQPFIGGLYDGHFGTFDHSLRCETCYNDKKNCLGHDGHLRLNYPVISPIVYTEVKKWLKVICFNCGEPIIKDEDFMKFPRSRRLDEAGKMSKNSNKNCVHCSKPHPIIGRDKNDTLAIFVEFYDSDKILVSREKLYPHKIGKILSRISNDTVVKLGRYIASHPRNYVLYSIKVPPITIRPDVKKVSGGRSNNDDLTTLLQYIIKKNENISVMFEEPINTKFDKMITELNSTYYDFVKGGNTNKRSITTGGSQTLNSLAVRLRGKQGRLRKNMMGRRVRVVARSTITGNCALQINEVGIPIKFAKILQIKDVVQEYNKQQLMIYFNNGIHKYPGCTKIVEAGSNIETSVDKLKENFTLSIGDKIYRDLVTGDYVLFNRQPSLKPSAIGGHRAVIIDDVNISTIQMNVAACPLYDADFDGDQMNLYIVGGLASRNEVELMSGVPNWMITYSNSSPAIGQIDDSIIGSFELTRSDINIDKYHSMLIFANSTYLPDFSGASVYTGRDMITKVLEETPINYSRRPTYYNENYGPYINYNPTEIEVKIVQGKHISGVLDKKSIGKGVTGSIYHIIEREYGADHALETIYNMQQLTIGYIYQFGYSVGIMDLLMTNESIKKIHEIESNIINDSKLITERLNASEIIPPIDKTVEEFYEEEQISALSVIDEFVGPVFESINQRLNNLYKMVICGSKGSINNIYHIVSAIGQIKINGVRPESIMYFTRSETKPESRGYITNSYLSGITSAEFIFNSISARFDFIMNALMTSVTGEQNRKSIKNLESIIVDNRRMAVKGSNIVQMLYGENGVDPRRIEKIKFPTIMMSRDEFEAKYHFRGASGNLAFVFDEEFNQLNADREAFRKVYLNIENSNTRELLEDTKFMPVNIPRIIDEVANKYEDIITSIVEKAGAKINRDGTIIGQFVEQRLIEIRDNIAYVKDFCERMPYILVNEIQEKKRARVPEYITVSTRLFCILARSYLCSMDILWKLDAMLLKIICDKIRMRYTQALVDYGLAIGIIAAQSFSGPLTQYMLDSKHRSITGGTSTKDMIKTKEVLGAKSLEQMDAPAMVLTLTPDIEHNKSRVQEIANSIEVMSFVTFISVWQIFFEKFNEPIHPKYIEEKSIIAGFLKYNPVLKVPSDLIKWCIRIVLNKTTLILKNMTLEIIINKLRETYPDIFIVYTPENAKQIILRIYIRNVMFKGIIEENNIQDFVKLLLDTVIRGVPRIQRANVIKLIRHHVNDAGAVERESDKWGISTLGSNMSGILAINKIDARKIITDSSEETFRILGIEAARTRIIEQIKNLGSRDTGYSHVSIYADEMTYTGRITSIERSGLATREMSNILLRLGFSSPIQTLEEAGTNVVKDKVRGITGPILLGTSPRYGTKYNSFQLNEEAIAKNTVKADAYLDLL